MEYMTDSRLFGCFLGFMVVVVLALWLMWLGLYRLWRRHFRGKPIRSGYRAVKLIVWLLLVALVGTITLFLLGNLWSILGSFLESDLDLGSHSNVI